MINNKKQKLTLKNCLATLFIFALLLQLSGNNYNGARAEIIPNQEYGFTSIVGIIINETNVASYSSSGTGVSASDPYIIDNLMINTINSTAVRFEAITSHFVLRDSYLKGQTYGVYIAAVTSGTASIVNCTVEGALTIGGPNAHYLNIYNNTLRSSQGSSYRRGLNYTRNVVYATGSYSGSMIRMEDEDNIMKDNIFYGNTSSIRFSGINNSTIEGNVLHSAGFYIFDDDITNISNNTFSNNIVNGKPFGFIYNRTDETISGNQYGQIYLVNSINTAIEGYTISDVNVGIQVQNCTNITIDNVVISGKSGIEAINTQGILIENCNLNGFDRGIVLDTVNSSIVQNNYFTGYWYGLEFAWADIVQINNNSILDATEYGIYCEDSWNIDAKFNIISCYVESAGSEVSIYFSTCENVTIFYNVFISLGELMAHPAVEWSTSNIIWYNDTLEIGNYYSDWNGMGTYPLTGNVGSVDLYPFIDIDEDGLNEFDEVIVHFTDPFNADSDSDGLSDGEEVNTLSTDPLSADTDSDGMDDYWEVTEGTDPTTDDANEDPDEDDLTNIEEYNHNTQPMNNDTDSDGYLDGEEVEAETDPLNSSDYPIAADGPNLGLIIGIAGGVGAAIVFTAYILIRKRKSKKITKKKKK